MNGDQERIRQVIDNLVSNAIKYGRGRPIAIDLADDGDALAVSVIDHGLGIAPEEIPHIFDRFHRVPGHGGRGHGLGLYIASALARLHGGEIGVASKVGEGSSFSFKLPRFGAQTPTVQ